MRVCRNAKFRHTLLSRVRVSKMQGAEIEDEGSVLKYMTKSRIEEQCSSLLIMTQRLFLSARIVFLSENNQQITRIALISQFLASHHT